MTMPDEPLPVPPISYERVMAEIVFFGTEMEDETILPSNVSFPEFDDRFRVMQEGQARNLRRRALDTWKMHYRLLSLSDRGDKLEAQLVGRRQRREN
jgi:hypothetical protein